MNKSKFLILIIVGLLVSNMVLLILIFKDRKRKEGPKNIIIEKLHFNEEQIERYESFIKQHRKAVNVNEHLMSNLRSNLYEQLKYSGNSFKIDSLITIIGNQQIAAEHINYNHFLEIKKLCLPNQTKDFDELTKEISNLFYAKKRKQ